MRDFNGKVLFLDRSDINTDEIIPARYLTEIRKEALKPYLFEDLVLKDFAPTIDIAGKRAIVARDNFGCGSSREHAPWSLAVNGINIVIAVGFARIFRQNMFNCGMIATLLAPEEIDLVFHKFAGKETLLEVSIGKRELLFSTVGESSKLSFNLSGFEEALVRAGGWVDYADSRY